MLLSDKISHITKSKNTREELKDSLSDNSKISINDILTIESKKK